MISLIEIWESTTDWDASGTSRSTLLAAHLYLYENYWDLTQGTTFDGKQVKNPCKRRQQLGLDNVYFTNKITDQAPFTTDQGWFSLQSYPYLFAENVDLSNTHQFTVEFEMYIVNPYPYLTFYFNIII